MNFFSEQSEQSEQNIRLITNCPACNCFYNPVKMKIIEESNEAHLVHMVCEKCGTQLLALVFTGLSSISSQGLVTELTSEEVKKFKSTSKVEIDDVIDLHFLLDKEEGRALALL